MITNTDTLQMFTKMYNTLDANDRDIADKVISGEWYKAEPYKVTEVKYQDLGRLDYSLPLLIGEAIRAIKADIKQTESGKTRSSAKKSMLNAMIKSMTKRGIRETDKYTMVKDGRQYYLYDGVIGFSFAEVDDTFPICPDDLVKNYFPLEERILGHIRDIHGEELELPSYKLLENYCKQNKQKYSKTTFCFGENQPTVNADYLLKVMKMFPTLKFYQPETLLAPIYGIDEDGNEVVLLPMRAEENTGRTQL